VKRNEINEMINDNGMTINTPKLLFISAQTTRRGSHISNVDVRGIKIKNKKIKKTRW